MTEFAGSPRSLQAGEAVRRFYEELPFNSHATIAEAAHAARTNTIAATYPDLHELLTRGDVRRVLEVGSGTGWFTNTLVAHYSVEATGIDFCRKAVECARAVGERLGHAQRARFVEADLFAFRADEPVDLVVSLGVLHHTADAPAALRHVLRSVRGGGHAYIGLYHEPGRRVFLELMRERLAIGGEAAAKQLYRELDHARGGDDRLAESWFRDQVLHPHETQHTLREVVGWLAGTGFRLVSTSINRFAPLADLETLFRDELSYAPRARRILEEEKRFFPGFFTFLASHSPLPGNEGAAPE